MSAEEIGTRLVAAIEAAQRLENTERDGAILEHNTLNPLVRWIRGSLFGWRPPKLSTRSELVDEVCARCNNLSQWMMGKQLSSFYMGSDMSAYIKKPLAVAERVQRWGQERK